MQRRLRRQAHRPSPVRPPAADRQGRRVGPRAFGRRLLQAAQLDVAALPADRAPGDTGAGKWTVTNKAGETLTINIEETLSDTSVELGIDPGLVKDGVEAHLQELLAEQLHLLGDGWRLIRREYPTPIGPVDIMCRDDSGEHVAVEMKRHAGIDAVEQLTRYLELLNRDPLLSPVHGVLAAQTIKLQARTLAEDRGIRCVVLDYDAMRGIEREGTLF